MSDGRDEVRRAALERSLASRFWLRFHMSIMLFAAFSSGFMTSFALLRLGVDAPVVRWLLGTLAGYVVLFFCMRLWLAYVGVRPLWGSIRRMREDRYRGDGLDLLPNPLQISTGDAGAGGAGPGDLEIFQAGGGRSGGGGASSAWGDVTPRFEMGAHATPKGGSGGFDLDFVDGDGLKLLVLVVIVLALAAALGGGVIYLVFTAPHLLADVALGAALTSGIAPAARRVADADDGWSGSVFKATWKPFAVILVVVLVASLALAYFFPDAKTLGGAFRML